MLGGYPKLNKFLNNKPSHVYNNLYFLNGRSSLSYLLDKLKVTKLYLPYYICPEIIKLLKKKK